MKMFEVDCYIYNAAKPSESKRIISALFNTRG